MQTSQLTAELQRRRELSNTQLRMNFLKYVVAAFLSWGMAAIFIDHFIQKPHQAFIDLPAALIMFTLAAILSTASWVKYKDWDYLKK